VRTWQIKISGAGLFFAIELFEKKMRFELFERYTSQDGKLEADVVSLRDFGHSAVFKLKSGEVAVVNYDFVRRGYWRKK
jgi:hypothetical protein